MRELELVKGLDLYLFDQLQKGRISKSARILDAGCGSGRNLIPLKNLGFNIIGFDPNTCAVEQLNRFGLGPDLITTFDIVGFRTELKFDFIICNAVLHFAKSHLEFNELFSKLWELLAINGILFIRMTSDFATKTPYLIDENGVSNLPDNSTRYILTKTILNKLQEKFQFTFLEPIKTTNVQDLRCMTTLVLKKVKA